MKFDFKSFIPHIIALVVFLAVSMVYFYPQLQGKKIISGDLSQWNAMAKELLDYKSNTGDDALWTGSMFSGMPTFQIHTPQSNNLLQYIEKIFTLGFSYPLGFIIVGLLSMYFLFILLGVNRWLAIIGAILFVFSTTYPILIEAGHVTKFKTIMVSPILVAGVILLSRKKWLIGLVVYSFGFGLNLFHNHVQMTYYLGMVVGIFVLIKAFEFIKEKSFKELGLFFGLLLAGTLLGIGSTASKLWTTYEYGKQTMRGEPILEQSQQAQTTSSNVDGLEWNYAMTWSNGWEDIWTSFQPMAAGGGSIEMVDGDTPFARAIGSRKKTQAPLYYGGNPSVAGPVYFGVIAVFLFLLSLFIVKENVRWWLLAGVVLTMLISLGKNFEIFNRILFDTLPFYNKFRTPNSILNVTAMLIPILGILGIDRLIKSENKEEYVKTILKVGGAFIGVQLLMLVMGDLFVDFRHPNDGRYEQIIAPLIETRKEMFSSFTIRGLILSLIAFGTLYFYSKNKLNETILILLIGVIGVFDLISIDQRYLSSDDFETARNNEKTFLPRDVDKQIKQDPDIHYRVYDVSQDPFNNAFPSYHHKTIGGYHPAKLQRYQDVIERHISQGNINVLNMLNTKYIISQGREGSPQAQVNPEHLGNAWMISEVEKVTSANQEIDALTDFNPSRTAVIHEEFNNYISKTAFNPNGSIALTDYSPNEMKYSYSSTEDQFVVFSEVWYQPGWNAYIDNEKVDHIRVNYVLRGLNVPEGNHEIVFRFEPGYYFTGEWISLLSSLLILGLGGFTIYRGIKETSIQ